MADVDVHYGPVTIQSDPVTVDVKGLDNSHATITLETPQPLKAETKAELAITQPIRSELAVTQPIKTESTAALDIQPLAVDQCLTLRLGPLPATCIRQPYQVHLGITLFGVEILGFNLAGESQTIIPDLAPQPQVAWGGEAEVQQTQQANKPGAVEPEAGGGLRIRLGK